MATIRVTDLRLRTVIGTNDWERESKQDIVINIALECDAAKAAQSDDLKDAVDYKALTKRIIEFAEGSQVFLLEKLTAQVLDMIMEDKRILSSAVRIDKPLALRFSKSVSVEMNRRREAS